MAYTSHHRHKAQTVSAHRVQHVLKSGGCATAHKAHGGAVGKAEKKAEHELKAMHAEPALHEAIKRGGTADPGKQTDLKPTSAEHGDVYVEGLKSSRRVPRKRGGKIPQINVVAIHKHAPPMMMGSVQPPQAPGMPPPPMGSAPTVGGAPGQFNQGGAASYGAATGMSRRAEYERMKREGH
jgi:hypothetical protein